MSKRESIISAALRLLTQNGIHATPMSAIAKEAGTGMGTIYNYFPKKEHLINEIYTEIKKKEASLLLDFSEDVPLKTQFETYYRSTVLFFLETPLYLKFMDQLHASPIITAESKAVGQNAVECILQLIEVGKKNRVIKPIRTNELMQFIGGSVLSYTRWHLAETASAPSSLDRQLQLVWDAIKE